MHRSAVLQRLRSTYADSLPFPPLLLRLIGLAYKNSNGRFLFGFFFQFLPHPSIFPSPFPTSSPFLPFARCYYHRPVPQIWRYTRWCCCMWLWCFPLCSIINMSQNTKPECLTSLVRADRSRHCKPAKAYNVGVRHSLTRAHPHTTTLSPSLLGDDVSRP